MDEDDELFFSVEKNMQKDIRDIKRNFVLNVSHNRETVVYVAAVSLHDDLNETLFIQCSGTPLTHEAYDAVRDGFVLFAVDQYFVGSIPISYTLSCPESEWEVDVPLPMSVIKRYLTDEQKMRFAEWKSRYDKVMFTFEVVQILGVY